MSNEVKIFLTINLEGSTLVRKKEPEIIKYSFTKRGMNTRGNFNKKEGNEIVKKGTFKHYSLEAKPAFQSIKITKESYNYMISKECPSWMKPKEWFKMNKTQRLEAHFQRTCEYLGGKSYSYTIIS